MIQGLFKSLESVLNTLEKFKYLEEVKELLKIHDFQKSLYNGAYERKYLFVVFEGLDGCGKSTLTKLTSKRINGVIKSTPPECVKKLRPFFDSQETCLRRAFYSLGNYLAAYEIKSELARNNVVLDRFWQSTAAYAIAEANENASPDEYVWPSDLIVPDVIFYLNVSEAARAERMKKRTLTSEELQLKENSEFRLRLYDAYKKMSPEVTEIESDYSPPKKVAENVLSILTSQYNLKL